jgi:hypothetical protein
MRCLGAVNPCQASLVALRGCGAAEKDGPACAFKQKAVFETGMTVKTQVLPDLQKAVDW